MPSAAKRFEMVALLSSAARIPLPGATMACAVAARSWSLISVPISRYCHGSGSVGSDISEECEYLHAASPSGQISYPGHRARDHRMAGGGLRPASPGCGSPCRGKHVGEADAPTRGGLHHADR